ncbi:UNVERIFIED_CONTAM: hypothetical protein NCL1_41851 [Trichonephila clavipes]
MTHTSNERATETVLFAGMYARVRQTYANFFPFLADQRASRKMATNKQKAFCVIQFAKTESAITVQLRIKKKYGTSKVVTGSAYLDALQLWLFPQLEESEPNNFIWQQDGAPPNWRLSVRDWLNITVPNQWIGRKEPPDKTCIAWPPCSPDLMSCDFYMWGLIKDCVYIPPLPAEL